MMKNEVCLSIDVVTDYYKQQHYAYITDDFIFFKNINPPEDGERKFLVSEGMLISIVRRGEVCVRINSINYAINSPAIISIFPDFVFEYYNLSDDALIDSIFISLNAVREAFLQIDLKLLSFMRFNPVVTITGQTIENLHKIQNVLIGLYNIHESSIDPSILKSLFLAFLNQIAENYPKPSPIGKSKKEIRLQEITHKFLMLLNDTYPRERGVVYYAQKLNITPKYLSFSVKSTTGFTAIKWINNMILLDAKRLLTNNNLTIEKISEKLKYKSSTFFIAFFKERTGFTPYQYRKRINT